MAEFTVQNLEDDVHERLMELARREGRSIEDVARDILRNATLQPKATEQGLGTRLAARFAPYELTHKLSEMPRQESDPPSFE